MLWVLVEGTTDEAFFKSIMQPRLQKKNIDMFIYPYAEKTKPRMGNLIRSIKARRDDYICIHDKDRHPCFRSVKERLLAEKIPEADESKILVVNCEIESWLVAGLDDAFCIKHKIPILRNTECFTKENFEECLVKNPRIGYQTFLVDEILGSYDIDLGITKSPSLKRFYDIFLS